MEKTLALIDGIIEEHEDIKNRLSHSQNHVNQLIEGNLSRHLWEASAHDMRTHITHTRKLIEAHAAVEQELFYKLKSILKKAGQS